MPRRPRRTSKNYIENDNSRSITFSKRRDGLFKIAANLSTLTGARMAIVLESENGKMFAFGTPSVGTIVDSFLSGAVPPPGPDEQEMERVAKLRKELMELEENKTMQEQRTKESLARIKEIQGSSRMGKLLYRKVEDLSSDELNELLYGLARIDREIQDLLPPPPPQVEIGGVRDLSSRIFCPPHSHIQHPPPRRLPWWTPLQSQPSLQILRSPHTLLQSSRTQSFSLMNPAAQPSSIRAMSTLLLQQTQLSQHHSLTVRPQAHMMPVPNEAQQYNYQSFHGVGFMGNTSEHLPQTSVLPSPPPPPPPLAQPTSAPQIPFQPPHLNLEAPTQNYATNPNPTLQNNEVSYFFGDSYTTSHPFDNNQQPSLIPCDDTYFGANEGHASGGDSMLSPSGFNEKTYEWVSKTLLDSSSEGESSSDGGDGDDLVDMEWLRDN